ncbi:MAG: hypothetical protein P4L28_07795 [Paludibacteraceae bacterium]|nr:hypothetical protein [Paludibacteraceae bacterium]
MGKILKEEDNLINEQLLNSLTEHATEHKRVSDRLRILATFNQFSECYIPVYRDKTHALKVLESDRATLKESEKMLEPHNSDLLLNSDLLPIQELNGESMIIKANEIDPNDIEQFYNLKFNDSGIKDETFFINEEIYSLERYDKDIIDEFPVLRYWISFLHRKKENIKTQPPQTKPEPTLLTIYGEDKTKLTNAHKVLTDAKLLSCNLNSWLYWFGGIPFDNPKQIQWKYNKGEKRALSYFVEKIAAKNDTLYSKARKIFDVQIKTNDKWQNIDKDINTILSQITDTE